MNKAYLMVGYPGSGKSTILKTLDNKDTDLILSSDSLREELYGFRDQTHNKEVFTELYKRAIDHKDVGDVYIDSTSLTRKDRLKAVENLKKYYDMNVICVLRPVDELVITNELRRNTKEFIPDNIFKRILGKFQLPTYDEGFNKIYFTINSFRDNMKDIIFDYNSIVDIPHDNPHHPETIKEHINLLIKHCINTYKADILRDLAYYHDLGKFFVKQYNEEKGYSQTIGHASLSAYIYLIDSIIHYILDYNKQQNIEGNTLDRLIDIYSMSNICDVLQMYYLIYYHDQPYACPNHDQLDKSLRKPSKPLIALEKDKKINIEAFVVILEEFNKIDSLR